jgi:dTDP-4-amino-4,6-dideoxygalactose transaminase
MIPLFKVFCADNICDNLQDVFESGYIGEGPMVKKFEAKLRKEFHTEYVSALNSGTSALHLAIHLIKERFNLNSDNEIITTALTCTATNWPILANGLKIKWADIDPNTLNISIDDIASKITNKTRIIMIVHWGGYPVDLDRLSEVVREAENKYGHKIAVIEDCAHAFGSTYKGNPIGSHGNYCAFSFQAIKHLTCGDGGALITPNKEQFDLAMLKRWYGIDRNSNKKDFRCEEDIAEWGFKFHMNDINATIGLTNLEHIDAILDRHKENASFYSKELKGIDGITLLSNESGYDSTYWIYTMLVDNREGFYKAMKQAGIMASQVHERNDKHSCVSEFTSSLPNLDNVLSKVVAIPAGWWVTDDEREYIVEAIRKGW